MKVLQKRIGGGARDTYASDLARYCKHRAFRTQVQRDAHYSRLLVAASSAFRGDHKATKVAMTDLGKHAVIIEGGDRVRYNGEECRVGAVLPEGKLQLVTLGGVRTVRAVDCEAIL